MALAHLNVFFDLNRAHARAVRRFDGALGSVHGIGLGDLHLLYVLAEAPRRRLRRIDLAQRLGVTASGVTWMLRPLVKRGLVVNEASEEDGRVSFAVLSDAGGVLVAEALPTARRIASEILDALDDRLGREALAAVSAALARLG